MALPLLYSVAVIIQLIRQTLKPVENARGVAMPLAMMMLVVLSALMVSFAVLATSEPMIASNQNQTAQALRLADSGLQLAMWAMSNSTDPSGKGINLAAMLHTDPASHAAANGGGAAIYDGGTVMSMTQGGFTVDVTWEPSNGPYERTVTAVGWLPSKDAGTYRNSHRKIQAIVQKGVITPLELPCVVCVAGEMQVNGSAATFNSSAGACPGSNPPAKAIQTIQTLQYNANPTFTGYGTSGTAAIGTTNDTSGFKYSSEALQKFKEYAQANGTYYQGAVSSLPTGTGPYVVYIDTLNGQIFSNSTATSNDGSLTLASNGTFNGLVYSLNDMSVSGNVTVNGGMVSENRRDASSVNIDTDYSGSIMMNYDCSKIRNLPFSSNWIVKPGNYLETAGY